MTLNSLDLGSCADTRNMQGDYFKITARREASSLLTDHFKMLKGDIFDYLVSRPIYLCTVDPKQALTIS